MIYVDGGKKLRELTTAGSRLLDIGCGTGLTVSSYRVGMQEVEIYGIDGYHDSAEVQANINFTKQDIDGTCLPYEDNFFDVVVLCHVLEHVRNSVFLIAEVFRVLRPNGYIYVETPSIRSLLIPEIRFLNEQYAAVNFYDDYTHVGRPQSIHSLYHLLNRNGFDILEVEYARPKRWVLTSIKCLAQGVVYKNRRTFSAGIWYLTGWAIYGIAQKNSQKQVQSHV